MSKDLIKIIQSKIQNKNKKFIEEIKKDINDTYKRKEEELNKNYLAKRLDVENKYKEVIQKIEKYIKRESKNEAKLEEMIRNIQKMHKINETKRKNFILKINRLLETVNIDMEKLIKDQINLKNKTDGELKEHKTNAVKMIDDLAVEKESKRLKSLLENIF